MIEEFSFGNFWSFRDIQSLNMTAAKIKSKTSKIDKQNIIKIDDSLSLLKSKAIYGANASGKSNIVKALVTFIRIIRHSVKDEMILSMIDSFQLSTTTENEPTFFQLIFRHNKIRYRYGFELNEKTITSEWLYGTPKQRELPFFIREENKIIEIDKTHFSEGFKLMSLSEDDDSENNEIFRSNSLFLSSVASFGFAKLSKGIIDTISSITVISGLGDRGMYSMAGEALKDSEKKKYIVDFLKFGDIGIEDIDTVEIEKDNLPENIEVEIEKESKNDKKRKLVISTRAKYDENFKKDGEEIFSFAYQESEGTKKLFELSPFIYNAIQEGRPLIVDEFDSRFHPLLTKKIVELFNSQKNKNSQLIFVTHDTNLLSSDLLRRDQIDFVEKDKYGASHLYTLVQFKGIRNTASFEKDYIQGKYGAIPFLGDFNKLFKFDSDA